DLDAWRRRLAVMVGELDQGLRYSRHVGIVAAAAQVAADARRGGGAWAGVGDAGRGICVCGVNGDAGHEQHRRGGRRRGDCRSRLSVCLARFGTLADQPANSRFSITTECPWTPSTRLVSTCPPAFRSPPDWGWLCCLSETSAARRWRSPASAWRGSTFLCRPASPRAWRWSVMWAAPRSWRACSTEPSR